MVKKYFSDPKGPFCADRMVWLESHSIPNTCGRLSFIPTSDFPLANVGFSVLRAKIPKNDPIFTRNSAIFGYNLSVFFSFPGQFSFFGSSLNAVVVFNAKSAACVTSKLKTTTAFNEEPKKECA